MTHFPYARDVGWPASKFDTTNIRLARGTKFKGAGVSAGADTGHLLYPGLPRYIPVDGLLSVTAGNRRERLSWPKRYIEVLCRAILDVITPVVEVARQRTKQEW
jgi:hypothetical protein